MKTNVLYSLLFTLIIVCISNFSQSQCTHCPDNETDGETSSAIGEYAKALGNSAFASGYHSEAQGLYSTAIGYTAIAQSNLSIALGNYVKSSGNRSIVIGSGIENAGIFLENNDGPSLMIGFDSKNPTFFVSQPYGSDPYFVKTGRIAIGNIRNSNGFMEPQAKLHLRADEGEDATIFIQPQNFLGGEKAMLALGGLNYGISSDVSSGFTFRSSADYKFLGGNVGIGAFSSNSPLAKLHIKAGENEEASIFVEPFRFEGERGLQASLFLGDMENGLTMESSLGMVYHTTRNHLFQGGNVGIGTAEPAALFHVEGNLGSFKYSNAKATISGKGDLVSLLFHNSNGDYSISKMGGMLEFRHNDVLQMGLSDTYGLLANKHITVGSAASKADIWPGADINVVQDGSINQKAAEFITAEGGRIFFVPRLGTGSYCPSSIEGDAGIFWSNTKNQNDDGGFVIGPHDTDNWYYGLRIDHKGNLGIGLSQPEARLHIKGGWNDKTFIITNSDGMETFAIKATGETLINNRLWATEVVVATENPWPDFVFNETYSLPSLSEVEAYINENNHLPDVPSAEEVIENGINLGDMDAILLQKIEELTLYVIELEKKVEQLEEERKQE
jgi:hypothetical protein